VSWKSSGREDVGKVWPSLIVIFADRLGDVLSTSRVCRREVVDGYVGGMHWYPHPHIHYLHASPCSWRVPSRE
jgi:hypothetical protein